MRPQTLLTTLSIAGASATALALYITLHLLAAGALATPTHAYRQTAIAALVQAHTQATGGAQNDSFQHASADSSGSEVPSQRKAADSLVGILIDAPDTSPLHLESAALLTLVSPRAP